MPDRYDLAELTALAVDAAQAAGALLLDRWSGPLQLDTKSSETDVVSDADRAAEHLVTATIAARRPDDAVLAEESGAHAGDSGLRWVIDPLDGTVNFVYGRAEWAVSVAVEDGDDTLAGAVYVPTRGEMYTAAKGGGAYRGDTKLTVTDPASLSTAMLATGFSYDAARRGEQGSRIAAVLPQVRDIRRTGSCAVDLVDLAAGRTDAFYEDEVNHWDVAAAALIASEAGATVGLTTGGAGPPTLAVLAAGPTLYPAVAAALAFPA